MLGNPPEPPYARDYGDSVCPRCREATNKYSLCAHIWHSQQLHSSDCNYWVNEPCDCMFGKAED